MITSQNLSETVNLLNEDDKQRILKSQKEFVVLFLHIFNAGSYSTAIVTDNLNRFKNVSGNGNAILNTSEIQNIIKEQNQIDKHTRNIPENIARLFRHLEGKANRQAIFTHFRNSDESNLYPILNNFNATERAIRRLYTFEQKSGEYLTDLELCLFLDSEISNIVNS